MLVKITNVEDELYFSSESNKDIVNTLINNFDELYLSNKSLEFHYGDVDVSICTIHNGLTCTCTRDSFTPWFTCDSISIVIKPTFIDIFGERDENINMQTHIECDDY